MRWRSFPPCPHTRKHRNMTDLPGAPHEAMRRGFVVHVLRPTEHSRRGRLRGDSGACGDRHGALANGKVPCAFGANVRMHAPLLEWSVQHCRSKSALACQLGGRNVPAAARLCNTAWMAGRRRGLLAANKGFRGLLAAITGFFAVPPRRASGLDFLIGLRRHPTRDGKSAFAPPCPTVRARGLPARGASACGPSAAPSAPASDAPALCARVSRYNSFARSCSRARMLSKDPAPLAAAGGCRPSGSIAQRSANRSHQKLRHKFISITGKRVLSFFEVHVELILL